MPLKRILKTMGVGSLFSFFISEVLFLYFLERGVSRFPETLIVCLVVISTGLCLESIFFPPEVLFLTSSTSVITLIAIVSYLFGSSTDPSILANFFTIGGETRILEDYLVIGLLGSLMWVILLTGIYDFLRKIRKISISGVYLAFSTTISRITSFFDKHPWFATILVGIITLLVGILIGRKG